MPSYDTTETGQSHRWIAWSLSVTGLLLPLTLGLMRADRWPLSGDESLYAYWSRHWLENRDPLFLAHWIDKPPIFLWLQSLALYTFGPGAASARYVNILATSLLCLGLAFFVWRQWGWKAAWLCLTLAVANPLILAYGPTGLTDPVLVLAGTAACLWAWQKQYRASGVALAVAVFSKQAGLLYLPLVLGTAWLFRAELRKTDCWRWVWGLSIVSLPILIWDGVRMFWAPSFWYAGFDHYAPLRLIPMMDLLPRLSAWLPLYGVLLGGALGWAAWGTLLLAAGWFKVRSPLLREDYWIGLALLWALGYATLHWLLTFNPWVRYLLPLVPFLVLSTIWAVKTLSARSESIGQKLLLALLLACLFLSLATGGEQGWHGNLPEMQDRNGLAGLPEALDLLLAAAPAESVILHRELSWHLLFYLFDFPSMSRVWFAETDHVAKLVADQPAGVAIFQLRLARDAAQTREIGTILEESGYSYLRCAQEGEVSVYEILREPAATCRYVHSS